MNKLKIRNCMLCALMAALIAAGAFIKIPMPAVPFTLQTVFVTLAGLLLGPGLGAASAGLYMLLGLVGLPIFTQGGGIGYVLNPTFGYIIGFIVGAFLTGLLSRGKNPSYWRLLAASLVGLAAIYAVGVPYLYCIKAFYLNAPTDIGNVLLYGFLITLPGDVATSFAGALLAKRLIPLLRRT